jgi:phosphoribosylformylglycinamidine synthase
MKDNIRRLFVEKKNGFDIEAKNLLKEIHELLNIKSVKNLKVINRYDIENITNEIYQESMKTIFSEPPIDNVYENLKVEDSNKIIAIEYLPGQYDQRADSAIQCIQILTGGNRSNIKVAKLIILEGIITQDELQKIKNYCINPVESHEAKMEIPEKLTMDIIYPKDVEILDEFLEYDDDKLKEFLNIEGLAMSFEDLKFCQEYFKNDEKRAPSITELKVLDTYWSDHCRHTTFLTKINNIEFEDGFYKKPFLNAYNNYIESREKVYVDREKDICLMDIATIAMKELRKDGKLNDLEISDEINACSIVINVDIDKKEEEWLLMFKNETHNHPTEIEPFGGAATCLGGAIRDPLSGRSFVYQAMRVTGSGDPRTKIENTIKGKLPQRKITVGAAEGYSSYGNQIGLATGQVAEIYDEGYVAKRMEIGAVVGAVPKRYVRREKPNIGDIIVLLGGKTGRDGCGGATGSSKEHDIESLESCGAEVQKGNAPTERKIQRFFRKEHISLMIKKCNDFGAGGVSVAIGELADSLDINLDRVPKKYEGLDGTELSISESQERMAVVLSKEDVDNFIEEAKKENLEATVVAEVTDTGRLCMFWRENKIVDLRRSFLDSNGVKQNIDVNIKLPEKEKGFFKDSGELNSIKDKWVENLEALSNCSQKGLVERFDSSIGAGTVLMPFGGKYQLSPENGMAAKIPVLNGETDTASLMTYGYNPKISKWSPFHGAVYAVIESLAKIVAMGGDYKKVRLTLQEYFEKLGNNKEKWGKPFSALLGAYYVQNRLGIPAIGGKDSMSGTFMDLNVPPTLVSFAVTTGKASKVVSASFKRSNNLVCIIYLNRDEYDLPKFDELEINYNRIKNLIELGVILSASTVLEGGVAETISKMSFGNKIGFEFNKSIKKEDLFKPDYGSIIVEVVNTLDLDWAFSRIDYSHLGNTTEEKNIIFNNTKFSIDSLIENWEKPLEKVFPTQTEIKEVKVKEFEYKNAIKFLNKSIAKPNVFIPVFPGTNCEYDSKKAFLSAGAKVETFVFRNSNSEDIELSIQEMVKNIKKSQIIMIPGGFSLGDEPDGSAKFISAIFRNPYVKEAVTELLEINDGLILGICNGFQALIKLGLLPFGKIKDIDEESPVLTFNSIGRHASCMVRTKIVSNKSPWLLEDKVGDVHLIPVSHGEGRFVAKEELIENLAKNGQIATQYVDVEDKPTYNTRYNPNGSIESIEGILSPDGRVFGKMGHSERCGKNIAKNVIGNKYQNIFKSGVNYFK